MIACESTAGPCAYARVFTHRQPLVQPTHSTCGHEEQLAVQPWHRFAMVDQGAR
jgi:hypothetical protein